MKTRSFAKTGSGQTHRQNKKPHSYPTKRRVAAGLVTVSVSVRPTSFNARTPARSSSTFATLPAQECTTPGGTLEKHRRYRRSDSAGWFIHPSTWVRVCALRYVCVCQMGTPLRVSGEKGQFAHLRASRGQKSTRALSDALDAPSPCKATQTQTSSRN